MMMRAVVLVFLASCFSHVSMGVKVNGRLSWPSLHRTASDQVEATVAIRESCPDGKVYDGSGVIVGHSRVVTAAHVINCETKEPNTIEAKSIEVDPGDGHYYPAHAVHVFSLRDVATLQVDRDLSPWLSLYEVGPIPQPGERVCESAAFPRETYRCGVVEAANRSWFMVSMFTEFGNSGSGVYDADGRLVGVLVTAVKCQGDVPCAGGVAPIADLPQLLE